MNRLLLSPLIDFEVYLLMTMKLRIKMSHKEDQLAAKVADRGLSVDDAERIHERVAEALGDEASYFRNMKKLLGIAGQDATSVEYSSILWPGFDFTAIASEDGLLESAWYRHKKAQFTYRRFSDRTAYLEYGRRRVHRAIWPYEQWSPVVPIRQAAPRI